MLSIKGVLARFFPFFKDYIPYFLLAILGMVLSSGGTAYSAYLVKPLLDEIFIAKDKEMLQLLPYAIIAVYATKEAGRYMQVYFTAYIGQDIIKRFRENILENLLKLDLTFFHEYRTGELISRNTNDVERVRTVVSNLIPEFLRETLTIFGLVGVVIYQSPELAFYALIIMPLAIYPLSKLSKRMKKVSRASQEKVSDITAKLSEIFNNIEIIQANNAQGYEHSLFKKDNERYFKLTMKSVKVNELVSPIMETLGSIGVAVVIIVGGNEVIDGTMSVGSFFSFLTALFMLYTPIKKISGLYNKMQDAIVASERIFFLLDQIPSITDGKEEIPSKIETITFENVSLSYGEKQALKEVTLEAKSGEMIALIGDSGGGKSSLMNMLMRFYDPSEGSICINGKNLKTFTLHNLRHNIAMVTQRVYIFHDTIAANVAYGKEVDEANVIDALQKANAYEFVQNLPLGIHTHLDEFGTNLSGGQRQRIAIARAIYTNPQVLILDEATSALDSHSEQKITEAIEYLIKDKITFVIAHRLSTIKKADKIVLLKHGKISAIGSDEELLNSSKEYLNLKGLQH
ncbi:ABC transporter ATP-binding protein [Sulfurospirillum multivorans]|uniref:Lipid A export ATP-binding/permease protein n=2 Tax=Sulfurospirillum multivorans TaxID=66821 RepID=A0AA86ANK7_SULMK|nr:ABC transporter ATP-binding protein [Sulfurospirillum multivorans]AHJ12733.1 putative lipid A export ATP-binding/permease protein [Sulfurospirillum multivorans DSM 12446]QEH06228.1 putative lipid A export ATP-binding/permease protein [Sulfurospirillum multivorans]